MCCESENGGNYTYVAYASSQDGSNFSMNRNAGGVTRNFMAVYVSNTQLDTSTPIFENNFYNRWYDINSVTLNPLIIPWGSGHIYKRNGNTQEVLQKNDAFTGWLSDNVTFVAFGVYNGGNQNLASSYSGNKLEDMPIFS